MGFSLSPKAINRVREILEIVDNIKDSNKVITIPTNTPTKLSYTIFSALNAASKLPVDHADYKFAKLKEKYQVKIGDGKVIFNPRVGLAGQPVIEALAETRIKENNLILNNLTVVTQVVGACIKHKCTITFPDAALSAESFAQLKKWADKNDYSFNEGELPLVMIKHDHSSKEVSTA